MVVGCIPRALDERDHYETTALGGLTPAVLALEKHLEKKVILGRRLQLLTGICDYSIWYESQDQLGTNLVIYEANGEGFPCIKQSHPVSWVHRLVWALFKAPSLKLVLTVILAMVHTVRRVY